MTTYTWETETSELVNSFPSQVNGKTFVITGCSKGSIGALVAVALAAAAPHTLILLGRSISKVQPVIDEITAIDASTKVQFVTIELGDFDSVRKAAEEVKRVVGPKSIDYLINSAGIMATPTFQTTSSGHEIQFATNHLGHFLFTNLLIPSLTNTAASKGKVISVSSTGHFTSGINFSDLNYQNGATYDPWLAYGQAKSANVLFALGLAKRGVTAFSCHPASVYTGLGREFGAETDWVAIIGRLTSLGVPPTPLNTTAQAGATILRAALDPSLEEFSGAYLFHSEIANAAPHASDPEVAERLWELSERLVGQKFEL